MRLCNMTKLPYVRLVYILFFSFSLFRVIRTLLLTSLLFFRDAKSQAAIATDSRIHNKKKKKYTNEKFIILELCAAALELSHGLI